MLKFTYPQIQRFRAGFVQNISRKFLSQVICWTIWKLELTVLPTSLHTLREIKEEKSISLLVKYIWETTSIYISWQYLLQYPPKLNKCHHSSQASLFLFEREREIWFTLAWHPSINITSPNWTLRLIFWGLHATHHLWFFFLEEEPGLINSFLLFQTLVKFISNWSRYYVCSITAPSQPQHG